VHVNVNCASSAELERIPYIGPRIAAGILHDRATIGPFKRLADLERVKGVGPKTLERIRNHVVIGTCHHRSNK
jgi:competence protein ComEA